MRTLPPESRSDNVIEPSSGDEVSLAFLRKLGMVAQGRTVNPTHGRRG